MNYIEWTKYIENLGMFSHKAGTEYITKTLNILGNPQSKFNAIHIAGTNGKGSVASFVSSALNSAGYKTGKFISPHLVDFKERITIGDEQISERDFVRLSKTVKDTGVSLTEFEFLTALGFLYFAEQKVDYLVCEAGLGGRLDATNTLTRKPITVITSIGLDHTAVLGDTIEKIAKEKCGIIKESPITVTVPNQDKAALSVIEKSALRLIVPDMPQIIKSDVFGNEFSYKGEIYKTKLSGGFQTFNAVTAIEVLKNLKVDQNSIKSGLYNAFSPARLQVICENPLVVLDGAHNENGAEALGKIINNYKGFTAIIGAMRDKDYDSVFKKTLTYAGNVICVTPAKKERALCKEELLKTAQRYCKSSFVSESVTDAIKKAKEIGNPTFIFGSLYLAADVLKTI